MSDFIASLREKISLLEDEYEELTDACSRLSAKLEVLRDLLQEEEGPEGPTVALNTPPVKRKGGRPKGSKAKSKAPEPTPEQAELFAEAAQLGGTDPELAARLSSRKIAAAPRPPASYGPGVNVSQNLKERLKGGGAVKSDASISVEDGEE